MSFRFNFSNADSDDDETEEASAITTNNPSTTEDASASPIPPNLHTLSSLLLTLPRNISYTFAPTRPRLPRRELYDVRMQLMAEDSDPTTRTNATAIVGLGNEDIRTGVYEGGLKSWECSLDLATHLAEEEGRGEEGGGERRVLELGCGTALPSLCLFRQMLERGGGGEMVLADYNTDVLRLVTLPNFLLVWTVVTKGLEDGAGGDLDASQELRDEFEMDLQRRGIALVFISGAWGEPMLPLLGHGGFDLVMGSETIYSPYTTPGFTRVLLQSLKSGVGRGLVATKRIYFGVGGSVEDFVRAVEECEEYLVRIARDLVEVGVGRVILEVSRKI